MATSRYVPEYSDKFLSLFPHRFDYLYADHVTPGNTPQWRTETKHPLSDRMVRTGAFLYGVRFGATTRYLLLDIDSKSAYHPRSDRHAVSRIVEALEPLGLVSYVAVTSSYSGGLHLYFPLPEAIETWRLAVAIAHILKEAGFAVEPGQLEVYPAPRNYDSEQITLYKGHRLPLQQGSYLLGDDWQQLYTTPSIFVNYWQFAEMRNALKAKVLEKALTRARSQAHKISHRASKFLGDLNTDIESGWTDHGQTNFLLGRIALRSYVFGHFLEGGEPREGERLILEIVAIASQLPGYSQWCRHQHEIWKRAEEWARCVENSRYWHYKTPKPEQPVTEQPVKEEPPATNLWNQWQQQRARDRITLAIADLLEKEELPAGAKERFILLTGLYHIGGETLYNHRDLWHPDHLWNTPPDPPAMEAMSSPTRFEALGERQGRTSLFTPGAGNALLTEEYRRFVQSLTAIAGGNDNPSKAFSPFDREREGNDE